jgi:hypothetical protein
MFMIYAGSHEPSPIKLCAVTTLGKATQGGSIIVGDQMSIVGQNLASCSEELLFNFFVQYFQRRWGKWAGLLLKISFRSTIQVEIRWHFCINVRLVTQTRPKHSNIISSDSATSLKYIFDRDKTLYLLNIMLITINISLTMRPIFYLLKNNYT